jgi:hypothetical protein
MNKNLERIYYIVLKYKDIKIKARQDHFGNYICDIFANKTFVFSVSLT